MIFIELLQNAAILSFTAFALYYVLTHDKLSVAGNLRGAVILGVGYGAAAFAVTATPLILPNGATVDARAGPVILAGIWGGPVAALIAGAMGGFARFLVGGSFAFSGVIVYILYALLGTLLFRKFFTKSLGNDLSWRRLGLGAGLSVVAASLMFFLIQPRSRAIDWITHDFALIALANITAVIACGLIARVVVSAAHNRVALSDTLETLKIAKTSGRIGTWSYDIPANKVEWDQVNIGLHGMPEGQVTGDFSDWEKHVHPDDLEHVNKTYKAAVEKDVPYDTEYRVIHDDGTVRHLKANATVLRDASGEPVRIVGANIDITEITQKELELKQSRSVAAQAQKLDAVGKLTGGVAHDFNNLLAVIQGNLELLLDDEYEPDLSKQERQDMITSAVSACRRGGELTRNMLAFARQSSLEPRPVKINDIVRETESWLTRAIPATISVETSLQHKTWPLRLDPTSLQSAIVNVIVNARDAMPDGGKLTIETSNVRLDDEYLLSRGEDTAPGRYVMLAISDTGTGIDPELMPTVFDPFVSSKDMSVGTGLGLSMVQGFVKQSGGIVQIYSEVGTGTSVKMFFPISDDAEEVAPKVPRIDTTTRDGPSARILVAEDQLEVLAVIVRILKSAGYTVDAAASGDDAFRLFQQSGPQDLLLTDVVMPGELRGPDLARACREIQPDLPVIFMSGYASEATIHGNGLRPEDVRLSKPVPRLELLKVVRECLDRAGQSTPL